MGGGSGIGIEGFGGRNFSNLNYCCTFIWKKNQYSNPLPLIRHGAVHYS